MIPRLLRWSLVGIFVVFVGAVVFYKRSLLVLAVGCGVIFASFSLGASTSNAQVKALLLVRATHQTTSIALSKSLDPAQHHFQVIRGTQVYAVPAYEISYRSATGGFTRFAYGTVSVSRSASGLSIMANGISNPETFPASATMRRVRSAFLFVRPGMAKPAVAQKLTPSLHRTINQSPRKLRTCRRS